MYKKKKKGIVGTGIGSVAVAAAAKFGLSEENDQNVSELLVQTPRNDPKRCMLISVRCAHVNKRKLYSC